ncbi:BA14K family protein [Rhizobium sp. AAP43]|uniref:BA14K family protein n=1 Tax=Rhizobium sp. AAP43 TaxID=1523420 RepID=UPI0006B89338|nr:BA14K family protein [Rhizobium sp. AAP43]KPF43439.1 hypothetical protein IP76_13870 [Rhizobium sp. AAP43]
MKSALLLLSGVGTTVALLIGGLAVVQAALPDEAQHHFSGLDNQPLWTSEPVTIANRDAQDYQRLAARLPADTIMVASLPPETKPDLTTQNPAPGLDYVVTSALKGEVSIGYAPEHLDWCRGKYRSYRVEDNTYLSFSGERRACASPFETAEFHSTSTSVRLEQVQADTTGSSVAVYAVSQSSEARLHADPVGIQRCAERYHSYSASDNTYQPFGGGPRRACEIRSF